VRLSDREFETRRAVWTPPKPKVTSSYLARYAKMATIADTGAILEWDYVL
jgi:dihydroxy-acid dehydratase